MIGSALVLAAALTASDCLAHAADRDTQAHEIQTAYLRQVPPEEWSAYLEASDALLKERYEAERAACLTGTP